MKTQLRVFSCTCGKMHCCVGIWKSSVCSCGANLWDLMWERGV